MKNLIYSPILLFLILSIVSCNKGNLVIPRGPKIPEPATCNSARMVSFTLKNSTGIDSYEIDFSGTQNYVFIFPPDGTETVSVMPGSYSVYVHSQNFLPHHFSFNNQQGSEDVDVIFDNVTMDACGSPQSFYISE